MEKLRKKKKKKIRWNAQLVDVLYTQRRSVNVQGKYSWRIINLFYSTNKPFLSRPSDNNNKCPISKNSNEKWKKRRRRRIKKKKKKLWPRFISRRNGEENIGREISGPVPRKRVNKLEIYLEFRGFERRRTRVVGFIAEGFISGPRSPGEIPLKNVPRINTESRN